MDNWLSGGSRYLTAIFLRLVLFFVSFTIALEIEFRTTAQDQVGGPRAIPTVLLDAHAGSKPPPKTLKKKPKTSKTARQNSSGAARPAVKPRIGGANLRTTPKANYTKAAFWTKGNTSSAAQNAKQHWRKHRAQFPNLRSFTDYAKFAKSFLHSPPDGTLTKVRSNGDVLRYNPKSNIFAVMNKNGTPKTLFRPREAINYWNKQ